MVGQVIPCQIINRLCQFLQPQLSIYAGFRVPRRRHDEIDLQALPLVIRPPKIIENVVPQLSVESGANVNIGLTVAPDEILTALRSGSVEGILGIG